MRCWMAVCWSHRDSSTFFKRASHRSLALTADLSCPAKEMMSIAPLETRKQVPRGDRGAEPSKTRDLCSEPKCDAL